MVWAFQLWLPQANSIEFLAGFIDINENSKTFFYFNIFLKIFEIIQKSFRTIIRDITLICKIRIWLWQKLWSPNFPNWNLNFMQLQQAIEGFYSKVSYFLWSNFSHFWTRGLICFQFPEIWIICTCLASDI